MWTDTSDEHRSDCLRGIAMVLLVGCSPALAAQKDLDFNRDIRPILSNHCYACHGPDEQQRKAGLRLDRKEDAFKQLESGSAPIVPGQPGKSELVTRITAADADEKMPPPEGKALSAEQV